MRESSHLAHVTYYDPKRGYGRFGVAQSASFGYQMARGRSCQRERRCVINLRAVNLTAVRIRFNIAALVEGDKPAYVGGAECSFSLSAPSPALHPRNRKLKFARAFSRKGRHSIGDTIPQNR